MTNGSPGPGPCSYDIGGPVQPHSNSNKCMLTYRESPGGEPSKVTLIQYNECSTHQPPFTPM